MPLSTPDNNGRGWTVEEYGHYGSISALRAARDSDMREVMSLQKQARVLSIRASALTRVIEANSWSSGDDLILEAIPPSAGERPTEWTLRAGCMLSYNDRERVYRQHFEIESLPERQMLHHIASYGERDREMFKRLRGLRA